VTVAALLVLLVVVADSPVCAATLECKDDNGNATEATERSLSRRKAVLIEVLGMAAIVVVVAEGTATWLVDHASSAGVTSAGALPVALAACGVAGTVTAESLAECWTISDVLD
jgi:hypothetical protein